MRAIPAALVAVFLLVQMPAVRAAELVMFEQEFCEWCEAWHEEVGAIYPLTDEGKILGLRKVDIHDERPEDLVIVGAIRFTPTFVVLDQGQEVGRILGYNSEEMFYWLLSEIIEKLPASTKPKKRAQTRPLTAPANS